MKLVSFEINSESGTQQYIGVLYVDQIVNLDLAWRYFQDIDSKHKKSVRADSPFAGNMLDFLRKFDESFHEAKNILGNIQSLRDKKALISKKIILDRENIRLLAPVPRPNTIRDFSTFEQHQKNVTLKKTGGSIPPIWYQIPVYWKANPENTIGPDDSIIWPRFSTKLDFELEFGIYISKPGKNIPVDQAKDFIAGYTIFNDISARDQQEKEMVMTFGPAKGKDFDNSKVFGPYLVTPDEFQPDGQMMKAFVNEEQWSSSSVDQMYWTFEKMISYASQSETLMPGDFLASGTCPSGCGIELDKWIKPGDTITLEVEGLGKLSNRIIQEK